jgi:hypothetical protein
VFGKESVGLSQEVLDLFAKENQLKIPCHLWFGVLILLILLFCYCAKRQIDCNSSISIDILAQIVWHPFIFFTKTHKAHQMNNFLLR